MDFFLSTCVARHWYMTKFGWNKANTNVIVQSPLIGLVYPDHSMVYLEQVNPTNVNVWHKPKDLEECVKLNADPLRDKTTLLWILDTHHKEYVKRKGLL